MKPIVSASITCPGTMIGKPGGYGITKLAETISGPDFSRSSIFGLISGMYSQSSSFIRGEERGAHIALERDAARDPRGSRRGSG